MGHVEVPSVLPTPARQVVGGHAGPGTIQPLRPPRAPIRTRVGAEQPTTHRSATKE